MISLQPPDAAEDDSYLQGICGSAWAAPHHAAWLTAYNQYRVCGGNAWAVTTVALPQDVKNRQYALYDTRKSGRRIKAIRNMPDLLCCPMCGSETTGSVDHFLPRKPFPEFAVMAANLVPACAHCNSASKGDTYRGTAPESFIHPYFETAANNPLWYIRTVPPFQAATFEAVPVTSHSPGLISRVAFHLKHVLGDQFDLWAQRRWARLPQVMRNAIGGTAPVTLEQTRLDLQRQLQQANASTGLNSWQSAFFRGLQYDGAAHIYIATAATPLVATQAA